MSDDVTNKVDFLESDDIKDNLVIIKINQLYKPGMSADELYDGTRGFWRRKIESVSDADYALSVANGMVLEVYKIDGWFEAGTTHMKTGRKPSKSGRIEFTGKVAPEDIRKRYINKCVRHLFKYGNANPVNLFYAGKQK